MTRGPRGQRGDLQAQLCFGEAGSPRYAVHAAQKSSTVSMLADNPSQAPRLCFSMVAEIQMQVGGVW